VLIEVLFDDPLQPLQGYVVISSPRIMNLETNPDGDESVTLDSGKMTFAFTLEPDEVDSFGLLTAHGNSRVQDAVVRYMSLAMNRVKQYQPLVIKRGHFASEASLG
jgi:hypothetical protein